MVWDILAVFSLPIFPWNQQIEAWAFLPFLLNRDFIPVVTYAVETLFLFFHIIWSGRHPGSRLFFYLANLLLLHMSPQSACLDIYVHSHWSHWSHCSFLLLEIWWETPRLLLFFTNILSNLFGFHMNTESACIKTCKLAHVTCSLLLTDVVGDSLAASLLHNLPGRCCHWCSHCSPTSAGNLTMMMMMVVMRRRLMRMMMIWYEGWQVEGNNFYDRPSRDKKLPLTGWTYFGDGEWWWWLWLWW